MQTETTRKRFTVDEYYKMDEAGILPKELRTELIDGEIIEVTRMGSRHASVLSRAYRLFGKLFDEKAVVRSQLPFRLDEFNELEPDIALFRAIEDFYASGHPGSEDVLLIIEISDSSLKYDRDIKLPVYAGANVREVWIADLRGDSLFVFRDPSSRAYKTSLQFKRGDSISCLEFPDIRLLAQELLA